MARTSCPNCGAVVDVCIDMDTRERVPLDPSPEPDSAAPVYRIVGQDGPDQVVQAVTMASHMQRPATLLPDHRFDCPGWGAGRVHNAGHR